MSISCCEASSMNATNDTRPAVMFSSTALTLIKLPDQQRTSPEFFTEKRVWWSNFSFMSSINLIRPKQTNTQTNTQTSIHFCLLWKTHFNIKVTFRVSDFWRFQFKRLLQVFLFVIKCSDSNQQRVRPSLSCLTSCLWLSAHWFLLKT